MRRLLVVPAVLLGGAALPCTASAQIVKAPTGETSSLKVASSQTKTFKKHKLTFSATGAAKKSGSTLTLPYSLSRWDFGTREGDVAYYAKKTGFKLKRGKRTATAINPRLVLDTPRSGYISMLISNERIKFFTVSGAKAKAADSGNVQQTTGYTLKLTQAGANYVNRALRKKALKRFSRFGTLDVRIIQPAAATPQPGVPSTPGGGTPGQGDTPGGIGHDQPRPARPAPRRRADHAADPGQRARPRRRRQGRSGPCCRSRAWTSTWRTETGTIKLGGGLDARPARPRHPGRAGRTRRSCSARTPACTRTSTACG